MKTFAPFALVVILALAWIIVPQHLATALTVTVYGVPLFLFGAGVVVLAMWAMKTRAGHIKTIAEAREIERRSLVQFHHAGNRIVVYQHEGANGSVIDPTLEAAWRITGGPNPGAVERIYNNMHGRQWRVTGPEPLALPEPEPQPEPILSALRRTQRGLIVGVQDAGKSTLLRYLADDARDISQVAIVDPHTYNGKWPAGCDVVGAGRDFVTIDRALGALLSMMNSRYQRMAQGNTDRCNETPVTVIVDEWLAVARMCPGAKEAIVTLLSESRKAAMRVYVACHSDSVKSLGLDGQGDLRDGFEVYHLDISQQTGERRAYLEIRRRGQSRQVTPLALPGPYSGGNGGWRVERPPVIEPSPWLRPGLNTPAGPSTPTPNDIEARVVQMHREGASLRQIAREVLVVEQPGKTTFDKIREIIERASE